MEWRKCVHIVVLAFLLAGFYVTPAIGATTVTKNEESIPIASPLASIATLTPTSDTTLQEAHPTTNYDAESLTVGRKDGGRSRALLEFNIGAIPLGATINSATLRIYQGGWYDLPNSTRTISVDRVTSVWHEAVATWNYAPTLGGTAGTVDIVSVEGWYEVDITTLVQEWYTGAAPNYGVLLRGYEGSGDLYRVFAPRFTTDEPQLVVDYTVQPATLDVSTNAISFTTNGQITSPSPSILHIKNVGTDTIDWSLDPGSVPWLEISSTNDSTTASYDTPVEISIIPDTLSSGIHTIPITITAAGAQNSPQIVNITVNYNESAITGIYLPVIMSTGSGAAPVNLDNMVAMLISIADYDYLGPAPTGFFRTGDWGDTDLVYNSDSTFFDEAATSLSDDNSRQVKDPEADLANIGHIATEWLDSRVKEPDQPVIAGYSGHGGPDGAGGYFMAAQDTNDAGGTLTNALFSTMLDGWLDNLVSQKSLVIIDACYSELALADLAQTGRVVLVASRSDQSSWESNEFQGGVFTHYVVQALLDPAADTNDDGYISAEEVHVYATWRTDSYIFSLLSVHQNPQIYDGFPGQFYLVAVPSYQSMGSSSFIATTTELDEAAIEYHLTEPVPLSPTLGPVE